MTRRTRRKALKKHRNSSKSPFKTWKGRLLFYTGLGFIACTLILLLAYFGLTNYIESKSFRETLEEQARKVSNAEFFSIPENIQLDGGHITLPFVEIRNASIIKEAELKNINIEIDRKSILSDKLHIEKIELGSISAKIDLSENLSSTTAEPKGILLQDILPKDISISSIKSKKTSLNLIHKGLSYNLSNSQIQATPIERGEIELWDIHITQGKITSPLSYLQRSTLESARIKSDKDRYSLLRSRILLNPGEITSRGNYFKKSHQWDLRMIADKANVERILNPNWKKRISGELSGMIDIKGEKQQIKHVHGKLHVKNGLFEAVPILSKLNFNKTNPYRSVKLTKAECRIRYPYSTPHLKEEKAWLFDKIHIISPYKIEIRGHVIIGDDRSLAGTLQVGIPEKIVAEIVEKSIPNQTSAISQLFMRKSSSKLLWININLSGTVDEPKQDLSIRIASLLDQVIGENIQKTAQAAKGFFVDKLFADGKKLARRKLNSDENTKNAQQDDEKDKSKNKNGIIDSSIHDAQNIIMKGFELF